MEDFHIQWHITDSCNLRCKHCYQDNFTPASELDWPGLRKICDNLLAAMDRMNRKLTLSLTGGEPFLKEDIWPIIEYLSAKQQIAELNIITNATLIKENLSKLKRTDSVNTIFVSLDGASTPANDYIRGKGIFNKIMDNIRILKDNGFKVIIMFTVLRHNLKDVEKMIDLVTSGLCDGCIIERFIPLGQSLRLRNTQLLSAEELMYMYQVVFRKCGVDFFPESIKYHALKAEIKNRILDLSGAECVVGKSGCAILPNADVLPCRRFNLPVGNLLKESLADIWNNSPVLNALRQRSNLNARCRDCYINECSGCRALAYSVSGDYLSDDPLCWLKPLPTA